MMIDRELNYGRHLIKQFLQRAAPFSRVLDIGAGHGTDLLLAREVVPGSSVFAVEVEPKCQRELSERKIDVIFINIERDPLPFADGSVDIVIVNQVLEHTKEIFWVFHEISRVLSPQGNVIIGVPNLAALHNRILLLLGRQPSPIKSHSAHIRGFTKGDLLQFLESCFPGGYELQEFRGSNFYPLPPFLAKPLANMFPALAWGIFFLLEKRRGYTNEFLEFPIAEGLETNFFLGEK
jgi:SAM-dependent methyltransferase